MAATKARGSIPVCSWKGLYRLPLPHRTIPEAKCDDLDFVNVAYSHLLHSHWDKLDPMASGLTPFRTKTVLLKFRSDYVLSLEFFNWVMLKKPNSHTLDTHSIMIHILTKHGRFKSAESITKKLLGSDPFGVPPKLFESLLCSYRLCTSSFRVFDFLFRLYARTKKARNAKNTFIEMKNYGFLPTVRSCNVYIRSLLSLGRTDIALSFHSEMRRCRISPDTCTLNLVICSLCRIGKLENALEVFERMERYGLNPNAFSYNILISGYCRNDLMNSAMKLKASMAKDGIEATAVTYNTLIHGFCRVRDVGEANKLFTEMKRVGISPTTVTYNILIQAYSQAGNSEMGSGFFEEMMSSGVKPDVNTYNALVLGLCREGKMKKSKDIMRVMEKEELIPNASTFSALILGQCTRKNVNQAMRLYEIMTRNGYEPSIATYEMLISAHSENGDYGGAVEILRGMMRRRTTPSKGMLMVVCNRFCKKEELGVRRLLRELEEARLLPKDFDVHDIYGSALPHCLGDLV